MWGGQERFLLLFTVYPFIIVPPQLSGTQLFKLCQFSLLVNIKRIAFFAN